MPLATSAASIVCSAACSPRPASLTSPINGNVTVPAAETRTVERNSGVWYSAISRKSPGLMGAGMGVESCVPAVDGGPVAATASPASFQIAGASFGLGTLLVSSVCGKLATPAGRPDVLGVGACARIDVPAPSKANITRITGTSNVGPATGPDG